MDHILLVEDEAALRNSLVRCLQGHSDFEVQLAGTLKEAVATLERQSPSLVVLDLDLPDGSGLELVPELARRGLKPPIVVITADLGRFQAEFPDNTNVDVLAKPFEFSEFRRVVLERFARAKTELGASAFTVADYLQLAGMARRSVVLTISEGARTLGHIVVQDGAPRWAEDQLGGGEAAFRRLALLPRSEVSCQPLAVPIAKANLQGSLEQMLIDAARHADESMRRSRSFESSRPTLAPPTPPQSSRAAPARVPPPPPPRARALPPAKPNGRSAPTPIGWAAFQSKTAADGAPLAQEKVVNLNKTLKPNLSQILGLDPTLKAAARADAQGSVLEAAGEMDAETACAVVTMALRQVADATAELGLGRPSAWHVSAGPSTWYVVQAREELLVTLGSLNKNPIATLRKVAKSCGVGT